MKKKVLILGGSSDIGFELAKKFLGSSIYEVNLHFNSNSKNISKIKKKCNFIKANLSNPNYKNILKKFDEVIIRLHPSEKKDKYDELISNHKEKNSFPRS